MREATPTAREAIWLVATEEDNSEGSMKLVLSWALELADRGKPEAATAAMVEADVEELYIWLSRCLSVVLEVVVLFTGKVALVEVETGVLEWLIDAWAAALRRAAEVRGCFVCFRLLWLVRSWSLMVIWRGCRWNSDVL